MKGKGYLGLGILSAAILLWGWNPGLGSYLKMENRTFRAVEGPLLKLEEVAPHIKEKSGTASLPSVSLRREAFHAYAERVIQQLARNSDLEQLTDAEVHFTPPSLLRSGDALGRVEEKMESDPDLRKDGVEFFRQCAENSGIADPLRQVCAENHQNWVKRLREDAARR